MNEKDTREEICEAGRRLSLLGMVAANSGNISCRINEKEVLITPTMVSKASLTPDAILKIDLDGNLISGRGSPTSETFSIHLPLISADKGINAVVHAHPVYTSAFILTGKTPPRGALVEMEAFFNKIRLIQFALPGSMDLSKALLRNISGTDAFLLSNHGAVTVGANLTEALYRMEALEHSSKILFLAKRLGRVRRIPEKEMKEIIGMRDSIHKGFAPPY